MRICMSIFREGRAQGKVTVLDRLSTAASQPVHPHLLIRTITGPRLQAVGIAAFGLNLGPGTGGPGTRDLEPVNTKTCGPPRRVKSAPIRVTGHPVV